MLIVVWIQFGFLWSLNSFKAVILSISNFVQAEKIQNDPNLLLHDCEKYLVKLTWGLCVSVCQLKSSWNRLQWRQRRCWQKCKFWSGDKNCVPPNSKFYSQWQSWWQWSFLRDIFKLWTTWAVAISYICLFHMKSVNCSHFDEIQSFWRWSACQSRKWSRQ